MLLRRISITLLTALAVLNLSSCAVVQRKPAPHPAPKPAAVKPVRPATSSAHRGEVNALLEQATLDFKQNRLTTPRDNNAYLYYMRVLALDPHNVRANQGIADIAEKYLDWAIEDANAGHYPSAKSFLGKAHAIEPDQPNIPAVRRLIEEHQNASNLTYYLPTDSLNQKSESIVNELKDIGHSISKKKASVVITARTDSEGQWIYQQMNAATPDRIHARLDIGDRPSVRLIY